MFSLSDIRQMNLPIKQDVVEIKTRNIRYATKRVEYSDGSWTIQHHGSDIIHCTKGGVYTLSNAGWKSRTTKDRLSNYTPFRVYQKNGEWFLMVGDFQNGKTYDFENGMIVFPGGKVVYPSRHEDEFAQVVADRMIEALDNDPQADLSKIA